MQPQDNYVVIDFDSQEGFACKAKCYGAADESHHRGQAAQTARRCKPEERRGSLGSDGLSIDNCYQITIPSTGKPKNDKSLSIGNYESNELYSKSR